MTVISYRSGARAKSSSTVRIPAMPLPMTTRRSRAVGLIMTRASDARLRQGRCELRKKAPTHVVPPGQSQAAHVEQEVDFEREEWPASGGDRSAETARDQI